MVCGHACGCRPLRDPLVSAGRGEWIAYGGHPPIGYANEYRPEPTSTTTSVAVLSLTGDPVAVP